MAPHYLLLSHTSGLKIGAPVATLPGAWCYRDSARTGWPSVCVPYLAEIANFICNFCLSVHMPARSNDQSGYIPRVYLLCTLMRYIGFMGVLFLC